jgi:predicted DNA binding CopG/RHH family protein
MTKRYVKNTDEEEEAEFDVAASQAGRVRLRAARLKRKMPTSIALDEETIEELRKLAEQKGIPYQVLMRSFIIEGIKRAKKAA